MPSADVLFEEFAAFSCIVDHALRKKKRLGKTGKRESYSQIKRPLKLNFELSYKAQSSHQSSQRSSNEVV